MGVITTCVLTEGTLFGPISPSLTLSDPALLIGHRTCDVLPDIHTVKLDVGDHALLGDWVPYVQAARDSQEQNMEVILGEDGLMYFRVTCDVTKNTEVHIWYSDKYAAYIGVPDHKDEYLNKGTGRYVCPQCSDSFQYPYCLRAHMRFRCKYRQQQQQQQQKGVSEVHIKAGPLLTNNPHVDPPSLLLRYSPEVLLPGHRSTSTRQTHGRRPSLSGSSLHTGGLSSPSESSLSPLSDPHHRGTGGVRVKRPHSGSDHEVSPSESSCPEDDYESDDRSSPPKRPHLTSSSYDLLRSNRSSSENKQFNSPPSEDRHSPDIDVMTSSHSPRLALRRGRDVIGDLINRHDVIGDLINKHDVIGDLINRHDVMGGKTNDVAVDLKRRDNGRVRHRNNILVDNDKLLDVTMSAAEDQARSAFQRVDRKLLSPAAPMLSTTSLSTMMTSSSSSVLTPTTMLNMVDRRGGGSGGGLGGVGVGANGTGNMLRMLGGGGMMMFPPPAHHLALAARMAPLAAPHHTHHPMGVENSAYYAAAAAAAAAALNGLHYINNNNNNNNGAGVVNNGGYKNMKLTDNSSAAAVAQMAALPFIYRSPNPMLDKMIHHAGAGRVVLPPVPPPPPHPTQVQRSVVQSAGFPPMNLAQNWCAKCNTSFRMTSDLVYHMRSHHKREFDPVRKKKDDKLKCDVCGETFRERHHLTRHMTSHT